MKTIILTIIITSISFNQGISQDESIDSTIINAIFKTISLIQNDKIVELSSFIKYPLKRKNPIPEIKNGDQFILYYPVLFDTTFKNKLNYLTPEDIFLRNGYYGLVSNMFSGDIWFTTEGAIQTINYRSELEKTFQKELIYEEHSQMNSIISIWKENVIICKSDKFLIRIDLLEDNSLRYISWSLPKKSEDKPDLILYNGIQEFKGSAGGVKYAFNNGDWTYVIDDDWVLNEELGGGLYLRIFNNGVEKNSIKCLEIK